MGFWSGKCFSVEHKEKLSKARRKRIVPICSICCRFIGKNHICPTSSEFSKHWLGRIMPEEIKLKIKLANKGKKRTEETKRKISMWHKGKSIKYDTRQKIRNSLLGHKVSEECKIKMGLSRIGYKNPAWQGGISFEPYSPEFNRLLKEQIRKRDNYTCQECHFTQEQLGYKLPVHHIDFDKKNNNPKNLICLCKSCHGKTLFNREHWINYYQGLVILS